MKKELKAFKCKGYFKRKNAAPQRKFATSCVDCCRQIVTLTILEIMEQTIDIRESRSRVGLSQAKLAKLIGINQATLSQWELGKSTPDDIILTEISKTIAGLNPEKIQIIKKKTIRHQANGAGTRLICESPPALPESFSRNSLFSYEPAAISTSQPKAISLFAGCGGLSLGVKAAGFKGGPWA